jgi:hypothetical protein
MIACLYPAMVAMGPVLSRPVVAQTYAWISYTKAAGECLDKRHLAQAQQRCALALKEANPARAIPSSWP